MRRCLKISWLWKCPTKKRVVFFVEYFIILYYKNTTETHIGTLLLRKMMYIVYLTVLSIVVGVVRNDDVHALRDDVTTSKLALFLISPKLINKNIFRYLITLYFWLISFYSRTSVARSRMVWTLDVSHFY